MKACAGSSDQKASNTWPRASVAASGSVPRGERLGERDDVRRDAGAGRREHRAGAAEAGEDLVADEQRPVAVGHGAQPAQRLRLGEPHPARALHQRLDDDRGDLVAMVGDEPLEMVGALVGVRQVAHVMARQQAAEGAVHAVLRVRHRHRAGGVAVIGAAEGDELACARAPLC